MKGTTVRKNILLVLASAALVALVGASMATGAGEGQPLDGGTRNPVQQPGRGVPGRDRDHRRHRELRHAAVEQVQQRRRRDLRMPLGAGGTAEGMRPASGRTTCRRASPSSSRPTASWAAPSPRQSAGPKQAVHDERNRRRDRPERRPRRWQEPTDVVDDAVAAVGTFTPTRRSRTPAPGASRGASRKRRDPQRDRKLQRRVHRGPDRVRAQATITGTDPGQVSVTPTVAADKRTTTVDVRTFSGDLAARPIGGSTS